MSFAIRVLTVLVTATAAPILAAEPLPSWNDGPSKKAILEFVSKVTKTGSADFVPPPEHIAVFDNDGTLWTEQPIYVQVAFVLDRVKALAGKHPEWTEKEPFKSVLEGNVKKAMASGEKGIVEMMAATHAGMTIEEFNAIVRDWIKTARHPKFKRPYTDLVYQPMLELLAYLRAMDSRPSSSRAAGSSSFGRGRSRSTAFRRSK